MGAAGQRSAYNVGILLEVEVEDGNEDREEKRREKRPGAMRAPPRPRFQRPTTQLVHLLLRVQPPARVCLMRRATLRSRGWNPDNLWDANLYFFPPPRGERAEEYSAKRI